MTQALASGSSELQAPMFAEGVRRRSELSPSLNAVAVVVRKSNGGSALFPADMLGTVVIVGMLSASSVAVNGFESLRWFHAPDRGLRTGASLSPLVTKVATASIRSDVDVKLEQYRSLEDGWLDEQALAPGIDAVGRAEQLNDLAKSGGWPPTRSYVSGDGEVGLIWDDARGYADVGFWSDGSLVYHVRTTNGAELSDALDLACDLPASLLNALQFFAS